jgi:predicted MFS family arabinose efflux permease
MTGRGVLHRPAARAGLARRRLIVVRNPAFGLLWTGQLLSSTGNWLLAVALPVYVLHLTGSAREAGLAFVAEALPVLLAGPAAGVLADRWSYRATMIVSDLLRAGCVAALMLVVRRDQVLFLFAAVFAENTAGAFFGPAHSALLPAVTGRGRDLSAASAWYSVSSGVVRLAGAPAGGALYLLAGFRPVAAADALSYLISAVLISAMPVPHTAGRAAGGIPATAAERAGRMRFTAEFRAGAGCLRADPVLSVLLGVSAVFLLGNGALTALLVPYVVGRLHARATVVGVLFSALGAGYLLSAFAGRKAADCARPRLAVCSLLAAAAVAFAGFFDWPDEAAGLVFIAGIGLSGGAFLLLRGILLERRAAPGVVGRVSSVFSTAEMAATLAGAGLASVLVTRAGLTAALNGAIAVVAAAAVMAVRLPRAGSAEPRGQGAVSTRGGAVQPGGKPEPAGNEDDRKVAFGGADDGGRDPVSRDGRRPAPLVGPAPAIEERGLDDSGQHHRNPDTAAGQLVAEALRQDVQASFGRGVGGLVPDTGGARDRRDEHQAARSAFGHGRREQAGELDRGEQVERDELAGLGGRQFGDRSGPARAGVADQQIDPAGGVQNLPDELLGPAGAGQITGDRDSPGLGRDETQPAGVPARDDQVGPGAGQRDGGRGADA